ncbi:helix-turn-helix transcriptional regulator [candidate division WOR-3 bacterium]|nr:helix-turn-helix transcriptional regulator [candidate division WOR-3 bacterium]
MIDSLTDFVLTTAGFELFILVTVLFFYNTKNKQNRDLLASFFLVKALLMTRWFVFRFKILSYDYHLYLLIVTSSLYFLLAPTLYLYVKSMCFKKYVLKAKDWLNFAPFAIVALYLSFAYLFYVSGVSSKNQLIYKTFDVYLWNVFWTGNFIQIAIYVVLIFKIVRNYQSGILDKYSSLEKISLSWMYSLLLLISLHWIFIVSRSLFSIFNIVSNDLLKIVDLFSISIYLFYVTVLFFKSLLRFKDFEGIDQAKNGNRLDQEEMDILELEVKRFIKEKKPFLKPALTIEDFSQMLSVQPWKLSTVINVRFKTNFYGLINKHRIEEAKKMLKDPQMEYKTVLQILYEVGFNSKSTFNDVFKKLTGMTPVQFKKSV